jgi:hypothetical protein
MLNETTPQAGAASDIESASYMDELPKIWGKRWGAQSEIGHLRSVMVSRPSDNEASPEVRDDPHFFASQGSFPNLDLMRRQHRSWWKSCSISAAR